MANTSTQVNMNVTTNFSDSTTGVHMTDNTTTDMLYEHLEYYELQQTIQQVLTWCYVVMVGMALPGNILTSVVMTSKKNRGLSSAAFFAALGVADLMVILFGPLARLFMNFTKYNLSTSVHLRTFKTIMLYTSIYMSSWMIVFLTVERAISVTVPHKIKTICINRVKLTLIAGTCFTLLCYNTLVHTVFLETHVVDGSTFWVEIIHGVLKYAKLVDSCLAFYVPVVVLIIGSVYIVIRIALSGSGMRRNSRHNTRYITKLLIASICVFTLMMSPYYAFLDVYFEYHSNNPNIDNMLAEVCIFLADMNSALNFYVYFLTGTKFRNDVRKFVCRCKHHAALSSSYTFSLRYGGSSSIIVSTIRSP